MILAKVRVGESFKVRFCVVLESLPDGSALIFPCSSTFEQCRSDLDFEVHDYLEELGAAEIVGREAVDDTTGRPLLTRRWSGAVDTVGGNAGDCPGAAPRLVSGKGGAGRRE